MRANQAGVVQWTPFAYAAAVLAIALIGGLLPVFSKIKDDAERLKQITGIAEKDD